ncbi:MAG: ABC transporter permease subunit, partial [Fusobacteriaceae bacterium]
VGHNPSASENAGINVKFIMAISMGISGILAGLAGAERVLGGVGQYTYKQGLVATYGFDGIAVALLGKNSPWGALAAAILFASLRVGGRAMQFNTSVPSQIVMMIQAIIILLIAAENMFRFVIERKKGE